MSDLKVGDVVYLNSDEKGVKMTVASISDGEIQCIYFNQSEQKFVQTMAMPKEAVTLVSKPNEGFYK